VNPRLAAARVLLDVAAGRRADSSLERRARALAGADRALCQEIAFGALRWKRLLDYRLDALLKEGLDSVPLSVRAVLEVAAYQLLFLDRVPPHAAVHDAVEHVRELLPPAQSRGLTGVVNATLRALVSSRSDAFLASSQDRRSGGEELGIATSHPTWLVERWIARFGEERARAILAADNRRPGLHLRPHSGRITAAELVERLQSEGASATLHPLDSGCVVLGGGDPTTLEAYREGLFAVQDVSAQIVARLAADPPPGLFVDACAAPGGKVGAAAERPDGRTFLAVDVSRARLVRVMATARRMALPLHPLVADARTLALARPAAFVLADVPCLGTGTFRRRVDARWQKSLDMLPGLLALQREILAQGAGLLAPGGRLLYATCSLEREENEDIVARLLESRPELRLVDLTLRIPPEFCIPFEPQVGSTLVGMAGRPAETAGTAGSVLFITPEAGDCDGAFAALFERLL
jgi:16S rRNA (cytosine967-C5)-methyltransferase